MLILSRPVKTAPPADEFSPAWPAAPWWASALANLKLRYLFLLLILGAGAIILSSRLRPSSSSLDQVCQGENNSTFLVTKKATDISDTAMQVQSPALESSQETAAGSGKETNLTIATSGQGQIKIGGDVINANGNVEKNDAE
ncbi:MAG: hypothetical protein D3906_02380 [Candidatus Electrothrix sp. AUS1_2]|nr:hypothetical protein [Candidatus Electrothrix sp. AUS1_2]